MATRGALYAAAAVALLTACATQEVPQPKAEIDTAAQAVSSARQTHAYEFASFDMTTADRKLQRAQDLASGKDDEDRIEARRLAEQATLDARLAATKARLAQAQATKTQMATTVDALRKETEQNTRGTP